MELIFLDIELSGMRAYDQVIELSAINNAQKVIVDSLILGAESITPKHEKLTGINIEQTIKHGKKLHDQIKKLPPKALWISYGLQFDINWINHTLATEGYNLPEIKGLCLLEVTKNLEHRKISLDKAVNKYCDISRLQYLNQRLKQSRHNALFDSHLHQMLFQSLRNENEILLRDHVANYIATDVNL